MKKETYYNGNRTFKEETHISKKFIFSLVTLVLGISSLFFLFGVGIRFTNSIGKETDLTLGELTWGGDYTGMSAALIVAFFFVIFGSLIALGISGFHYIGFLSGILLLTSAIMLFCAIPITADSLKIVGKVKSATLGYGTYLAGIFQIIAAGFAFVAGWGE